MEGLKGVLPRYVFEAITNSSIDSLKLITLKTTEEIQHLTRLNRDDVLKLKLETSTLLLKNKFVAALHVPAWTRISTGCPAINSITRGGLPNNGINELVGQSGVGKTQFCMQLALMVQLPKRFGGLEKGVLYVCTEDVFPLKRLNQLAQFFPLRFPQLVKNIKFQDNLFIEHVADYEQLRILLCVRLDELLSRKKIGLIVIDSIAAVFRSETEVNYTSRSEDFYTIAKKLSQVSGDHKLSVLCVNQVTDNIDTKRQEPCLGLSWSNLVTCRFKISRCLDGKVRNFEVVFAPDLPSRKCKFLINSDGLTGIG